jgi:hypothetical protein
MSKRSPSPRDRRGGHYGSRGSDRTRDHDGKGRYRDMRNDHYNHRDGPSRGGRPWNRSRDNGYSHLRGRHHNSGNRDNNERRPDSGWGSRTQGGNARNPPVKRERSASRSRSRSPPRKRKRSASRDAPHGKELIRRPNRHDDQDSEMRVRKRDRSEDAQSDRRRARSASRCA